MYDTIIFFTLMGGATLVAIISMICRIKKDNQEGEYAQKQKIIEAENYEKLVKSFIDRGDELSNLIDKYYKAVKNYIESLPCNPYIRIGEEKIICSQMVASPYYEDADKLLRAYIHRDGLHTYKNQIFTEEMETIKENTQIFIVELKNRISAEWNDDQTLSSAIYHVMRNNIIRYCYEICVDDGIQSMEDYFGSEGAIDKETGVITSGMKVFYTYFWIYQHDITSPITETYYRISAEMDERFKEYQLQSKKDMFFSDYDISTLEDLDTGFEDDIDEDFDIDEEVDVIDSIDRMTGREFEEFVADFFEKQGYKTTLTPSSGDYGIDVIIENDFLKIGIQTKCYIDKVPNAAVQEAVTGIKHYGLDKAMVITNSYFQPSAIQLAKDNNVILWDRDKLIEEVSE